MYRKQENSKLSFKDVVSENCLTLNRMQIKTLQVNLGRLCNQTCVHCHVDAGPNRTEMMDEETVRKIIGLVIKSDVIKTVDITGGAPEMNPHFRALIAALKSAGKEIIVRTNLTIYSEHGYEDIPAFLAANEVQVNASLPCYLEENVDRQRGSNTYVRSIENLKDLNKLGYGKRNSHLMLNLIYNPAGAFLPPDQNTLEKTYRERLKKDHGLVFTNLFVITNVPIKRFGELLRKEGTFKQYIDLLRNHFNPCAAKSVMCRSLLSIGWDGRIYDCDFNQALGLGIENSFKTIYEIETIDDIGYEITFDDHCFACTAGAGSSCGGALA